MSTELRSSYKKLLAKNKDLIVLGSAQAILHWDMETMMPPRGVGLRSEQLALLSSIHHEMSTAPAIGKLLREILKHPAYDTLSEVEKRNVQLIKKNYDEQTRLPTKLVAEIAKQQAITVNIWKKAKATQNFNLFKPELEKLVDLNKQAAAILMEAKQTETPYDALIDIYEPKMDAESIAKIFSDLQKGLEKLLQKIETSIQPNTRILSQKVPVEKQRDIAKLLVKILNYDISSPNAGGRIDETEHPFSTGYYDDVRITTHYHTDKWTSSIFSVLHETGHALYEQGLPQEWKYQPVGAPCSLGFHESQSRLYENIIGRSKEFWINIIPKIKGVKAELDEFIRAINVVAPSKIRIEADEVTYNLHVIIRFQIEKDLFGDKLTIAELPEVWNQKYKQALGVNIENDSEGVMQDTHWASGLYGYFPTYALGNIYSGQIINKIQQENPTWSAEVAIGNLEHIRTWLTSNIYNHGNLYDPADLLKKATDEKPNVEPYLRYLEEKYQKLYAF
ncbi:MAG: carboxypeptidase M32 [Candidatus Bathyarchaeota archaeon]|nr:carboxypeptidase M32 [Candidatus Bathyarchaeota archaeon]